MAKNSRAVESEEKLGSKIISFIVVFLIVVVWLGVMILLIKLDVGNFGSQVLRPLLKDIPVVNMILPAATDKETARETDSPYTTLQQAIDRIYELEGENASLNQQITDLQETIDEKDSEISRLKIFEENQEAFQAAKDEFYSEIVYDSNAPGTDAYVEWYEMMDSESAEKIYEQIIQNEQDADEIKNLAKTYADMKPQEAADILQEMSDDLDTVAAILDAMSVEDRAAIMGKMDPQFAANVTKKLLP